MYSAPLNGTEFCYSAGVYRFQMYLHICVNDSLDRNPISAKSWKHNDQVFIKDLVWNIILPVQEQHLKIITHVTLQKKQQSTRW